MKTAILAMIVALFAWWAGAGFKYPHCTKSHSAIVHHIAWTQYVYMSKGNPMYPIFHPAYDAEECICDEWVWK